MPRLDNDNNTLVNVAARSHKLLPPTQATVPATGNIISPTWTPTEGYDTIALAVRSDADHDWEVDVLWSMDPAYPDGDIQGQTTKAITATAAAHGAVRIPIQAAYFKVKVSNADASPHAMACWPLLMP